MPPSIPELFVVVLWTQIPLPGDTFMVTTHYIESSTHMQAQQAISTLLHYTKLRYTERIRNVHFTGTQKERKMKLI